MTTPDWSELTEAVVLGRPIKVWRRRPRTVNELMAVSVGRDQDDFLVHGDRRRTYGAFRTAVEAAAEQLCLLGVRAGDRVMIVLYNSPEFWLLQCAAWRLGAVPVLGNRWWSAPGLADAITRIAPALIATDMPLDPAGPPHLTVAQIARWWTLPAPVYTVADPDTGIAEDDVGVIVFTAGSTGAPKSVQLSHRVLVWTQQTVHVMRGGTPPVAAPLGQQNIALATTPLFHNGGMVAILGAQIDGSRIVFPLGRFDPIEAMCLIETERVTSWSAVPTIFSRLLRHPDVGRHDLSSLAAAVSGGAAVTPEFVRTMIQTLPGTRGGFSSGYGMTEMSFITMVDSMDLMTKNTVGRLVPGVELRVAEPDAAGEGELVARSAALMVSYLDGPDHPVSQDGWYRTGDRGRIDAEGFVYLTGRCKDMVIRGGENIACQHVEAALLTHPDVLEAAVLGVPDTEFGEAVAAIIHLRPGAGISDEALAGHARSQLAYFEVPTRWMRCDAPLPVLPTGKIDKTVLRENLVERGVKTPHHG